MAPATEPDGPYSNDKFDGIAVRGSENALSCFFSPARDAIGFITDLGVFKASLRDLLVPT